MSWRCGECGANQLEAIARCSSCDYMEIQRLREENRLLRLAVTEFAQEVKGIKTGRVSTGDCEAVVSE